MLLSPAFRRGLWYQLCNFLLLAALSNAGLELNDAVKLGSEERVATLLEEGASVTSKDTTGWTPLHNAANTGNEPLTTLLLQHNADINARDDHYGKTPLHLASSNGHSLVVGELLSRGASVDVKDANGQTPLHLAAWNGHRASVLHLIQNGADVNARDKYGSTPLRLAVIQNEADVAEALLSFCPDLRLPDNQGVTVEEFAKRKELVKITLLLAAHRRTPCSRHKLQQHVEKRVDVTDNDERCPRGERQYPSDGDHDLAYTWRLPELRGGETARIPCPAGTSGSATWACGGDGTWRRTPDLSKCHSLFFNGWHEVMATENITAAEIVTEVATSLKDAKNGITLAPGDLITIGERLGKLHDKHNQDFHRTKSKLEAWKLAMKYLEGVMELVDLMLSKPSLWWGLNHSGKYATFSNLQNSLRFAVVTLASHQIGSYQRFSVKSLTTRVMSRPLEYFKTTLLTFHHPDFEQTNLALPYNFYETYEGGKDGNDDDTTVLVAFLAFQNLHCTVNSLPCEHDETEPIPKAAFPAQGQVNTPIVGGAIGNGSTWQAPLEEKVIIKLQHVYTGDKYHLGLRTCVWWDGVASSWATDGCTLVETNDYYSICHCDHISNTAVVMDIEGIIENRGAMYRVMRCVTIVGSIVAVVSLTLCIVCFMAFRDVRQKCSSVILTNICFFLMASEFVLLIGLSATLNNIACTIVVAVLHYLFTSTFIWTAIEVFHKFLKHKVFKHKSSPLKYYMIVGYTLPLVCITVTFIIARVRGYTNDKVCWISTPFLIWSFAGPLAAVILFNVVIFLVALLTSRRKESPQSIDTNYRKSTSSFSSTSTKSTKSKDSKTKEELPFWANLIHEQEKKKMSRNSLQSYYSSSSSSSSSSRTATQRPNKDSGEKSNKNKLGRKIAETVFILIVFSLTWLFGFLYHHIGSHVLALVFTFLNSIQGLCILVIHIVTNATIMREVRSVLT